MNELSYLKEALDRIVSQDPELAEEIRDKHQRVANELPAVGGAEVMRLESMDPASLQGELETIVRKKGRPVLTVRRNDFVFETSDVESEVWGSRLKSARDLLRRAIPSVGRVELANNSNYTWVGTAWLVHEEIAVTNRHVAAEFARQKGGEFVFKVDPGFAPQVMEASVDFLKEEGNEALRVFKATKVLYIEPEPGPDLAFLQLEGGSGGDRLSPIIELSKRAPESGRFVAAIGYPARDSRVPDEALVSRVFGNIYDKKRLAPGLIGDIREQIVIHDASTLGGNSGSVLLDMKTGEAVGLHRAGLYLQANYAVPAAIVAERLNKVRSGRTVIAAPDKPVPAPSASQPQAQPSTACVVDGGAATWTIPINVSITLGQPGIGGAPTGGPTIASTAANGSPESIEAAAAQLRRQCAGREGIVNVRAGYRFQEGWITDQRAVVVAVSTEVPGIPPSMMGVPVEVTPASVWDFLQPALLAEGLERVPVTHYQPPDDVELKQVDETMRVVCHVSPDAGWPTLKEFLGENTSRLTIGIYDFTAPHIIKAVKKAVKDSPAKLNMVIQRGAATEGDAKKDDIPDEEVVESFEGLLKSRFKQSWASVSGPNRLFASAYHIKVIVRDGKAFWLSSGNLQSTNQPDIDPVADGETTFGPLRSFNREWHAVVENKTLAKQFEAFLLWDLEQAAQAADEALLVEVPMVLVPDVLLAREVPELEAAAKAKYFKPLEINRRVKVMPLLTPDNYQPQILRLIKGAKKRILFQNQSLNVLFDNDEPKFRELVTALCDKQRELDDVRIIIRGDFNPRPVLEKLKEFGFDMSKVRAQKKCHTKGLIVDSARVAIGSHNWTNQGTLVNRDASLIFFDDEIAKYYEQIFEFDWKNLAKTRLDQELPAVELARPGQEAPEGMVKMSLWDFLYGDG
jgi:hypothetical protein